MVEYHVSAYLHGKNRRELYDRVKAKSAKEAIAKVQAARAKFAKRGKVARAIHKDERARGWKATLSTSERQKRQSSGFGFAPRRRSTGFTFW
jgi:ABC-type tungstate transport system permease subunit